MTCTAKIYAQFKSERLIRILFFLSRITLALCDVTGFPLVYRYDAHPFPKLLWTPLYTIHRHSRWNKTSLQARISQVYFSRQSTPHLFYWALTLRTHPDRLSNATQEEKKRATEKFQVSLVGPSMHVILINGPLGRSGCLLCPLWYNTEKGVWHPLCLPSAWGQDRRTRCFLFIFLQLRQHVRRRRSQRKSRTWP